MILLGGHTASCFKNGKLFLFWFFWFFFFSVSVLNSIASSQPLESSLLSSRVVVWDNVPLGEGARLRVCEGFGVLSPFEWWKSPGAIAVCRTKALYQSLGKYFWGLTAPRAYACCFVSSRGKKKIKSNLWLPFEIERICAGFSSPLFSRSSPWDSDCSGCASAPAPSDPCFSGDARRWSSLPAWGAILPKRDVLGLPPAFTGCGCQRGSPGAAEPLLLCELTGGSR